MKGDGLAKATGAQRRQAAADAVEVEDRNFDGGGPQSAVIAAVEPAFKAASGEALPRNHGMGPGARRRRGALDSVPRRGLILLRFCCRGERKSQCQAEWHQHPAPSECLLYDAVRGLS